MSIMAYILQCKAIIIPGAHPLDDGECTVDKVPGFIKDDHIFKYGNRGWTRLEAMVGYVCSALKQQEAPPIYFVHRNQSNQQCEMQRLDYLLDPEKLPSRGELTNDRDRKPIKATEDAMLAAMRKK